MYLTLSITSTVNKIKPFITYRQNHSKYIKAFIYKNANKPNY